MAYIRPSYYYDVPEGERAERITLDSDLCHIRAQADDPTDNDIYAIRCTLDIPIHDVSEPFCWGLWVTQSKSSFERYVETYGIDQSSDSSFGWLSVTIPYYNRTPPGEWLESLRCDVHWGQKGERPKIVLQESDHPLYLDQKNGIDWNRAVEIAQSHMQVIHAKI